MSGRNAKLLARYARAMLTRGADGAVFGPRPRDLKRLWKTRTAKQKAAMRKGMVQS